MGNSSINMATTVTKPPTTSPVWYQLTFLVLGPLAAHLGSAAATPTRG